MVLVAESGSTKTDWLFTHQLNAEPINTMGFNPFFHTSETVSSAILANAALSENAKNVTHVYFFGAGCSSPERNLEIEKGLEAVFTNAKIEVSHDILAAAIACCGDTKGVSVIMGTGSNSCFWDGENLSQMVPALGYILGDEGSGSYFGKALLTAFIYKKLPMELHEFLEHRLNLTKEQVFENVYKKPDVNVYLASFAKILFDFKHLPWVRALLQQGFKQFIEIHLSPYPNVTEVPIHFVGSIAYNFSDEIKLALAEFGFTPGKFLQKPVFDLAAYYANIHFSK